ncbi:MAG: hypothetical protein KME49_27070 [Brasilonema octagenarum HA4186-MV1]|jgi:hypothetical protein|nr:hypothetical protein [Brasilonema octagenarum HA4186-MV1]
MIIIAEQGVETTSDARRLYPLMWMYVVTLKEEAIANSDHFPHPLLRLSFSLKVF